VKRSVQVEIAGQQLTIRSDEGAEYVGQLADYVDAHLRVLSGGRRITNQQGLQRTALLVAMQLADELFREKDLHQRFRRRVSDKLEVLRRAIDDHEQRLAGLAQDPAATRDDVDGLPPEPPAPPEPPELTQA
jgi:cell division protein ZapA